VPWGAVSINELCDWYVELTKPVLNPKLTVASVSDAERKETRDVLAYAIEAVLRLLHPFVPFSRRRCVRGSRARRRAHALPEETSLRALDRVRCAPSRAVCAIAVRDRSKAYSALQDGAKVLAREDQRIRASAPPIILGSA
jgi:isoleucyl-tRNA synthetase